MIDKSKLQEYLKLYKKDFYPCIWEKKYENEKFKWVVLNTFHKNWDIEAENFADMLKRSLSKYRQRLNDEYNHPYDMIVSFAKSAPEEVRVMFRKLFDDDSKVDVIERIENFKSDADQLLKKYGGGLEKHDQDEKAISTYLWFYDSDKYYIYKFEEAKKVATALNSSYHFKKGAYEENLRSFYNLYDEVCDYISSDAELTNIFKEHITVDCWKESSFKSLAADFCFHIYKYYADGETVCEKYGYVPLNGYSPNLTVSDWEELLNNPGVFTYKYLQIMKRMKDIGGEATCKQLSLKYGESDKYYNFNSVHLARKVCNVKKITPDVGKDGSNVFWSILYTGRYTHTGEDGNFVWKLRDELAEALDNMDLSGIELYSSAENAEPCEEKVQYKNRYSPVLVSSKNIIFHGAPGTGKTYLAKEIAADIVSSGETSDYSKLTSEQRLRIEFVQFHPSYDYSDFVEGLRPVLNSDGSMGFELRNGIFKSFVTRARKNYEDSLERGEEPEKFVFIIDEINRGEISKILGELFFAIDPNYRGTAGEVSTQYSNLHEDSDEKFYVPENVYIIGTMNDIDRSVDSFDFAMRRRFRFIELGADENIDMLDSLGELKPEAVRRMKSLNAAIAEVEDLNMNYQIGAAYFLKLREISFDELWTDNLKPLLQDYVQGIYGEEDIMKSFEKAYNCQNGDTDEESEN